MSRNSKASYGSSRSKIAFLPGNEIGDDVLSDLNKAWQSVNELKHKLQRTEDKLNAAGRESSRRGINSARPKYAPTREESLFDDHPMLHQPVRKVSRIDKEENADGDEVFQKSANVWINDPSLQHSKQGFEQKDDTFMYWDKWMDKSSLERKKDVGPLAPSEEPVEPTVVRVLNDHFEIYTAKLREDLVRSVGIASKQVASTSKPQQPPPLPLPPPKQEQKQKQSPRSRPSMVTTAKNVTLTWEPMKFKFPNVIPDADEAEEPKSGLKYKTNTARVTYSGRDSNIKVVEESEGDGGKHSRDSSTRAHLVSSGTDNSKKPLTVKKVVCSASKIEESAIKPSSWRRGQQLILKELGPNPLQHTPPVATATEETNSVNYSSGEKLEQPPTDQEPVLDGDGGKGDKESKILVKKNARKSKRHEPLKQSSPKMRHYDQESVRKFMRQQKLERKKCKEEDDQRKLNLREKKRQQLEQLGQKQRELAKVNLSEKKKDVPSTPLPLRNVVAEDPLDWIPATFSHLRKQNETQTDSKDVSSGPLSVESAIENTVMEEKENDIPSTNTPVVSEAVSSTVPVFAVEDSRKIKLRDIASQALKIQERLEVEARKLTGPNNSVNHQEIPAVNIGPKMMATKGLLTQVNEIPVKLRSVPPNDDAAPLINAKSENHKSVDVFPPLRLPKMVVERVTEVEADPMNFINTFLRKFKNDLSSNAHAVPINIEPIKAQNDVISVEREQDQDEEDHRSTTSSPSQHTVSLSEVEMEKSLLDVSEGPLTEDDTDTSAELLSLPKDSKDTAEHSITESKQSFSSNKSDDQVDSPLRQDPPKMSPAKLRLRMTTELTYLDSLHESLGHLNQVEHLRALAMSQQETATLARALQGRVFYPRDVVASNATRTQSDETSHKIAPVQRRSEHESRESSPSQGSVSSMSVEEGMLEVSEEIHEQVSNVVSEDISKEVSEDISGVSEGRLSMESFEDERSRTFKMLLPSESHRRKSFGNSSDIDRTSSASPDVIAKLSRSISQPFSGEESLREFTLVMVKQFMEEEEMRGKHQRALLKLREEAIVEKTRAEISWLHMQKKRLQDKGADDKLPKLRQKERGLLFQLRREQVEIKNLREAQRVASQQRQIILRQQQRVSRLRLSTEQLWARLRKMTPEKSHVGSADVNSVPSTSTINSAASNKDGHTTLEENEEIPEESFSIESSRSRRTESIHSQIQRSSPEGNGEAVQLTNNREESERSSLEMSLVLRKLETSKRHLTKREQRLHRRRQDVEELLEWHKRFNEEKERVRDMEKKVLVLLDNEQNRHKLSLTLDESVAHLESKGGTSSVSEHVVSDVSTSIVEDVQDAVSDQLNANSYTDDHEVPSAAPTSGAETRSKSPSVPIRLPLTPVRKRLDSSGSEGSAVSHSETVSDMSDVEGRIRALKDDLRKRKLEAEKLKRERQRSNRERLKAQEESLMKQIEAYDTFIERTKQDLQLELEKNSAISQVKPQIKKPKVAESRRIRTPEVGGDHGETLSPLTSPVSEEACSPSRSEEYPSVYETSKDTPCSSSVVVPFSDKNEKTLLQHSQADEVTVSKQTKSSGEDDSTSSCGVLSSVSFYFQEENVEKPSEPTGIDEITKDSENIARPSFFPEPFTLPSPRIKSSDVRQKECDHLTEELLVKFLDEDIRILGKYFQLLPAPVSGSHVADEQLMVVEDSNRYKVICEDVTNKVFASGFEEAFQEVRGLFALTGSGYGYMVGEEAAKSETSVSQRVHEILAKFSDKSPQRFPKTTPQDLLVLSPPVTYVDVLTAQDAHEDIHPAVVDATSRLPTEEEEFCIDQEWFDDDLGLEEPSKSPRDRDPPQTTDVQNYQIYQYEDSFYIREIPNKPPPPYSLPAGHSDQQGLVPTSESEDNSTWKRHLPEPPISSVVEDEKAIARMMRDAAQHLLVSGTVSEHPHPEPELQVAESGDIVEPIGYKDVFKVFLGDLSADLVQKLTSGGRKITRQGLSDAELPDAVASEALALMGLGSFKRKKGGLVGKKRDFVDEILIEELRKEETNWISYEEDELAVKLQIVDGIFKDIIDDTVLAIKKTWFSN